MPTPQCVLGFACARFPLPYRRRRSAALRSGGDGRGPGRQQRSASLRRVRTLSYACEARREQQRAMRWHEMLPPVKEGPSSTGFTGTQGTTSVRVGAGGRCGRWLRVPRELGFGGPRRVEDDAWISCLSGYEIPW